MQLKISKNLHQRPPSWLEASSWLENNLNYFSYQGRGFDETYLVFENISSAFIFWLSVIGILKKLSGVHFKVMKFKFVIHHGKISFGKRHLRISKSTNKRFPASKGYFSFTLHKKIHFIRFHSTGMKVFTLHGKKIVTTSIPIKKKVINLKKKVIKKRTKGDLTYRSVFRCSPWQDTLREDFFIFFFVDLSIYYHFL